MGIHKVDKTQWVLRLTPLLYGKDRAVGTDFGTILEYDGVKKAILSHHNANPER